MHPTRTTGSRMEGKADRKLAACQEAGSACLHTFGDVEHKLMCAVSPTNDSSRPVHSLQAARRSHRESGKIFGEESPWKISGLHCAHNGLEIRRGSCRKWGNSLPASFLVLLMRWEGREWREVISESVISKSVDLNDTVFTDYCPVSLTYFSGTTSPAPAAPHVSFPNSAARRTQRNWAGRTCGLRRPSGSVRRPAHHKPSARSRRA